MDCVLRAVLARRGSHRNPLRLGWPGLQYMRRNRSFYRIHSTALVSDEAASRRPAEVLRIYRHKNNTLLN